MTCPLYSPITPQYWQVLDIEGCTIIILIAIPLVSLTLIMPCFNRKKPLGSHAATMANHSNHGISFLKKHWRTFQGPRKPLIYIKMPVVKSHINNYNINHIQMKTQSTISPTLIIGFRRNVHLQTGLGKL